MQLSTSMRRGCDTFNPLVRWRARSTHDGTGHGPHQTRTWADEGTEECPVGPVPENATPGQSNTSQLMFVFFSTLLEVFRLGGGQFRLESREADPVARCPMSVSWAGHFSRTRRACPDIQSRTGRPDPGLPNPASAYPLRGSGLPVAGQPERNSATDPWNGPLSLRNWKAYVPQVSTGRGCLAGAVRCLWRWRRRRHLDSPLRNGRPGQRRHRYPHVRPGIR